MKKADRKGAGTPPTSKPAPKPSAFVDPLSMADPLSVSLDFDGSDPLSMMMKEGSAPITGGKSSRSGSVKVSILYHFFNMCFFSLFLKVYFYVL